MREQRERVGVILFWLLMLCTFLISALRKQQTTPAPSPNRVDTDSVAQKPQSSQASATPRPEPLVDSGMIEVALVIATVGFLLYQFGDNDDLDVPMLFAFLTMKEIGKIVVFVGILAAFILHTAFWIPLVVSYRQKIGYLESLVIPVLLGHAIIYLVLLVAVGVAARFAGGDLGLWLAILAMAIIILIMITRKS